MNIVVAHNDTGHRDSACSVHKDYSVCITYSNFSTVVWACNFDALYYTIFNTAIIIVSLLCSR